MSEIRAKKSGLAAEAQQKVHGKFDSQFAQQIFGWISCVTGETLPTTGDINEFISTLKDGVLLCKFVFKNFISYGKVCLVFLLVS